jgi:hypothetical protein
MQGNRRKIIDSKIEKFTHSQEFLPPTHNLKIPIKVGFERRRCKDVGLGFRV